MTPLDLLMKIIFSSLQINFVFESNLQKNKITDVSDNVVSC